ncbi:lantibiotic dehydratase family protein [Tenacibaculum sp. XPcli2-G]|uniref:lantibiotic dehydratase family protein n=1 Tax=Tenacibaculum sp. XPcli2-G TaxID=2954503 RepID=UPI002096FC5A|nr:lantibiotic dehydratase family protein [Tenacibaculum sp. XPcli2-G]MCO7184268.1 lantibiotic dehydratase family protein [Tenacibaculum sp. XPcli2-G]
MKKISIYKMKKNPKYLAFNNYVLRTPTLSFEEVSKLTKEKIKTLCKIPFISEAIYIASPELHGEMLKLINNKSIKNEKKLVITLLKYFLRMGNRATPFGLFSGCSVGEIEEDNHIVLKHTSNHKRTTRLDMNYLCALSQKLESDIEIRNSLKFYPNTSLYKVGDKLRYIEFKYEQTLRRHFTIAIDDSEYLTLILEHSKNGATIKELANLIDEPDVTDDEAIQFINELIDNQILISSISPPVTGEDYFKTLKDSVITTNEQTIFLEVENILNKINNSVIGEGFKYYQELYEVINKFNVDYNKKFLLQTDLTTNLRKNILNKELIKNVDSALLVLNKLSIFSENEELKKFKKDFYSVYEDEEIPLALALDVEAGIGYATSDGGSYDISPLIDDIRVLGSNSNRNSYTEVKWNKRDTFLNKKMLSAIRNNKCEIEITDDDLKGFSEDWTNIPDTFSAFISILDNDANNPKILIDNVGNVTATALLGRFCHSDEKVKEIVDEIVEVEESLSNVIYAEIVHLPEKRTGNVLFRPHLRDYEIPYLAKSVLPKENQIPIEDLLVSVKSDKVILRSKKLNKRVIPRLATAHNYSGNSLPIYYFLGDLQCQDLNEFISFSWGNVYMHYNFFPRVNYKNTILSPAQWIVKNSTLKNLKTKQAIDKWLEKEKIPNKVLLADDDNQLLIDFGHELSIEMFISIIKNKTEVILIEYLFNKENALVKNYKDLAFSHEIILSYYKNND